jgi:hypothetical protein
MDPRHGGSKFGLTDGNSPFPYDVKTRNRVDINNELRMICNAHPILFG